MMFTHALYPEAIGAVLRRWGEWRAHRDGSSQVQGQDRSYLAHITDNPSITTPELRTLLHNGADAASFLYRRMAALGLYWADVSCAHPEVMRDLERTCAQCESKVRCLHDFACAADRSAWREYCANDPALCAMEAFGGGD